MSQGNGARLLRVLLALATACTDSKEPADAGEEGDGDSDLDGDADSDGDSDVDSDGDTDADTDGPYDPCYRPAATAVCSQLALELDTALRSCCNGTVEEDRIEGRVDRIRCLCEGWHTIEGLEVDEDVLDACLAELSAGWEECRQPYVNAAIELGRGGASHPCWRVTHGTRTEGESCWETPDQCADGFECGCAARICTAPRFAAGEDCSDCGGELCNDGLWCRPDPVTEEPTVCVAKVAAGSHCVWPDLCEDGYYCDEATETCAGLPGDGEPCLSGTCAAGFMCLRKTGLCAPWGSDGSDCDDTDHHECLSGHCNPQGICDSIGEDLCLDPIGRWNGGF